VFISGVQYNKVKLHPHGIVYHVWFFSALLSALLSFTCSEPDVEGVNCLPLIVRVNIIFYQQVTVVIGRIPHS